MTAPNALAPLDALGALWVAALDLVPIQERVAWVRAMEARVEWINAQRAQLDRARPAGHRTP